MTKSRGLRLVDKHCYSCGFYIKNPNDRLRNIDIITGRSLSGICENCWNHLTKGRPKVNGKRVYKNRYTDRTCYACGSNKTYINCRNSPVWFVNKDIVTGNYLFVLCGNCNCKLFPDRKFKTKEELSRFRSEYSKKHVSREFLHQMGMKAHLAQSHRMSNLEKIMASALKENGIQFIPQFRYNLGFIDFFVFPNIAIYCDGEYWHNYPDYTKKDLKQTKWLKDNGYLVYRFWEREIEKDIEGCMNRLVIITPK